MTFQGVGSLSPPQFPFGRTCPVRIHLLSFSSFLSFYPVMSRDSCPCWSLGSSASDRLLFCASHLTCRCVFCCCCVCGNGRSCPPTLQPSCLGPWFTFFMCDYVNGLSSFEFLLPSSLQSFRIFSDSSQVWTLSSRDLSAWIWYLPLYT